MNIAIITRARAPYLCALQEALAESFLPDGYLHLLWPKKQPSDFDENDVTPKGGNVTVHHIDTPSLPCLKNPPSVSLWEKLHLIQPAIVWIHEFSPYTLTGLLYAKWTGIPVVVSTEVGLSNASFFSPIVQIWHGFWGHFVDGIIANAPAAHEPLCGEKIPSISVYHASDSRDYIAFPTKLNSATTTFVFLGHLIPRKGIDLLLDASLHLMRKGITGFRLLLIGRDHDHYAEKETLRRGLIDSVEFKGFLSGPALQQAMGEGDVFVLPTRQDTYAAVVHEAACMGLPLLISRHAGACAALVQDGISGYRFTPEDTEEFAACMAKMLSLKARSVMSQGARLAGELHSAHVRGPALREWFIQNYGV